MNDSPFACIHRIQLEWLARTPHPFGRNQRGHFQFFDSQSAVTAAIQQNFFLPGWLQPQRTQR